MADSQISRYVASANALQLFAVEAGNQMKSPGQGDLRNALRALELLSASTRNARRLTVQWMREAGYTWDQIGEAMGITRQAAWEKYRTE